MKTSRKTIGSEKGIALAVALTAAIVAFLIVSAVLSLTFNRFNLSFLQADHASAYYASEAGVRYAFTRLEVDNNYSHTFQTSGGPEVFNNVTFISIVRHAFTHGASHIPVRTFYVITSKISGNVTIDGASIAPDDRTNDLFMGTLNPTRIGREVTIWIQASAGTPEFRVRAFSDYGN